MSGHNFITEKIANGATERQQQQQQQSKKRERPQQQQDDDLRIINECTEEVKGVEAEIDRDKGKYEQCRQIMALGIVSLEATRQMRKMEDLMAKLRDLRARRVGLQNKREQHICGLMMNKEEDVALEEIREARKKRKRLYPRDRERQTEDQELTSAMYRRNLAAGSGKEVFRSNSANCPNGCKNLVEDQKACITVCTDCGNIYEVNFTVAEFQDYTGGPWGNNPEKSGVEMSRRRTGGYKPPVHYAEIIGHFQGARSIQTPADILEMIRKFADRYKYKEDEITPQVARMFLRRMQQDENNRHKHALVLNRADKLRRYTDYYKHTPEISHRLSNKPLPYLTPMQEERILALFPLIISAYRTSPRYLTRLQNRIGRVKDVPNNPNNFFVFYKTCQLLGYSEFLPYIPLPKSTDNIDDNDENAWKHICRTYGWQYMPTR
jgi:hypothetical protein